MTASKALDLWDDQRTVDCARDELSGRWACAKTVDRTTSFGSVRHMAPEPLDVAAAQNRRARIAVAALFLSNGAIFANLLPRYPEIKADLRSVQCGLRRGGRGVLRRRAGRRT